MAVTRRSLFGGFAALAASPFVAKAVAALPQTRAQKVTRFTTTGYARVIDSTGQGANLDIVHIQNGQIFAVNVTNGGEGYTTPPHISFSDPAA